MSEKKQYVLLGSQYDGEMKRILSVYIADVDSNMRGGGCLSYSDPIPILERNETVFRLSPLDPDMRGEMKRTLSVCLAWIPIWGCNET